MSKVLFDASAVLAILFAETGQDVARRHLSDGAILAINHAESFTKLVAKGMTLDEAESTMKALRLEVIPFQDVLSRPIAELWTVSKPFGLSLGDRACLAYGKFASIPILTADTRWGSLDLGIAITLLR